MSACFCRAYLFELKRQFSNHKFLKYALSFFEEKNDFVLSECKLNLLKHKKLQKYTVVNIFKLF